MANAVGCNFTITKLRMKNLINLRKAWAKLSAHRAKLRFCLRTTVAGLLAFAIAQLTSIPLNGLWVVLTAVVVTQLSVAGSLRATLEYIIGTVGGATGCHRGASSSHDSDCVGRYSCTRDRSVGARRGV